MADICDVADAVIEEGLSRNLAKIPRYVGVSAHFCEECDCAIPDGRRIAVPGVQFCADCQSLMELKGKRP